MDRITFSRCTGDSKVLIVYINILEIALSDFQAIPRSDCESKSPDFSQKSTSAHALTL